MRGAAAAVPGAAVVLLLLKGPRTPASSAPRAAREPRRLRHLTVPRTLHQGLDEGQAWGGPVWLTGTYRPRALGYEELMPGPSSSSTVGSDREPPVPFHQPGSGSSSTATSGSAGLCCLVLPCPALRPRFCCAPAAAAKLDCGWEGTATASSVSPGRISLFPPSLFPYPVHLP